MQVDKTQPGPFQIQVNNEFIIKQDPIHIQLHEKEQGPLKNQVWQYESFVHRHNKQHNQATTHFKH